MQSFAGLVASILSRVRYHLYYRIKDKSNVVEVLTLRHTSRYPDPGI